MNRAKETREVERALQAAGWEFLRRARHVKLYLCPCGEHRVGVSNHASEYRSLANTISDIRRSGCPHVPALGRPETPAPRTVGGYQPTGGKLDPSNPPTGGSGLRATKVVPFPTPAPTPAETKEETMARKAKTRVQAKRRDREAYAKEKSQIDAHAAEVREALFVKLDTAPGGRLGLQAYINEAERLVADLFRPELKDGSVLEGDPKPIFARRLHATVSAAVAIALDLERSVEDGKRKSVLSWRTEELTKAAARRIARRAEAKTGSARVTLTQAELDALVERRAEELLETVIREGKTG